MHTINKDVISYRSATLDFSKILRAMIAIIPVKLSERLPGKHLMKIGGKAIIEHVHDKVSKVFETFIYSKVELPLPFISDNSPNIMSLIYNLSKNYGSFALIGGDMPFFTVEDLNTLKAAYNGHPVVPSDGEGDYEPMFSIYAGEPEPTKNLREALLTDNTVYIPRKSFSQNAFFNINTKGDFDQAVKIYEDLKKTGKIKK